MGESNLSKWRPAFEELVLEPEPTAAPDEHTGPWFQALFEHSRRSFARLVFSPSPPTLLLRLEFAPGAADVVDSVVAEELARQLEQRSESDWSFDTDEMPWILETELSSDEQQGVDRLRHVLQKILEMCEYLETTTTTDEWLEVISDGQPATGDDPSATGDDSPFETIGGGDVDDADAATIEAVASTRVDDRVRVAIGFSQVLAPGQIDALRQGLGQHLHTKFDVQSRRTEPDDRSELRVPGSARTTLYLDVLPDRFSGSIGDLHEEVERFLERLEKFASYGVDLFEYLGVSETVLETAEPISADATEDDRESTLSFGRRTSPPAGSPPSPDTDEGGVVLDLGAPASTALEPNNYTDPRLQRPDADTALVDLVLRHPGYSDRRIGQVLSILLSIDYHDAVEIADSAPCVIAWAIGQQRAQTFKDVIETAGGKVVLVEPGTFGES